MIICSPQLGLSPEANLGGEVYDREILCGLDHLGVRTLIVLPWGKNYPQLKNAKLYYLPVPFVYPPWLFNFLALPYLFYLYSKFRFDVLRVHSPYFVGPAALLFGLVFPKVKIVPNYLHLEPENRIYDLIDRLSLPRYKTITTISEFTKSEMILTYGVSPERIAVVPCGVDEKYRPLTKNRLLVSKLGLEKKRVLLYLGQLIVRKNIPFLLKVIRDLPDDFVLLLCGDGPERDNLERICLRMNLSGRVIFTGHIPESDKVAYYNLADIFLSPSLKEGFGLSVLEALACGKEVIATNLLTFKEIGGDGLTLLPLTEKLWVETILRRKKRMALTRSDYSWGNAAARYHEVVINLS